MSIKTRWMNTEHTVLLISYVGEFQEWEFIAVMDQIHQVIAARMNPIHLIHDTSASNINDLWNEAGSRQSNPGALAS
ncbi:MAG: hypothetical protein KC496_06230 [Anaerolineae bacterium]|nr:hypothetical protein [Anaerolineae bacterium]